MKMHRLFLAAFAALAVPLTGFAWGPHPGITQAAMETLPADDPLVRHLGDQFPKLRDYCWMGDWRRQLRKEAAAWFYTDDYLLFPSMSTHRDHLCPDVKATYEPYFRRALQALRTETSVNAARWVGAILHFTEDTGSPPHAAQIRGDVHSKMENWVDAKAITIAGYQPRLLGNTDDEAVSGFLNRMDGLIAFSKERAERAKPFVLKDDRAATEPIVLESAVETSRVVADLLHTLGKLAEQAPASTATLRGVITSQDAQGLEKVPAKVVLLGTKYSTLADAAGRYQFHNLPPGPYRIGVLRVGSSVNRMERTLAPGETAVQDFTLSSDAVPGNLLRNSELRLSWITPEGVDAWRSVRRRIDAPHWEGELVPLTAGTSYRLKARWQDKSNGQVVVHLLGSDFAKPSTELKPLMPGETDLTFTATKETVYAQVRIYAEASPRAVVEHVSLSAIP